MYGSPPVDLGYLAMQCDEMLFYQDLPIKLAGQGSINPDSIPCRLSWLAPMVGQCACDFVGFRGLNALVESYVYVSAKHLYQAAGCSFNRPGWHCDGFGSDDINYIWSNCSPTVFNVGQFDLPDDDEASMEAMALQADPSHNVTFDDCHVLRLDQFNVHRVSEPSEPQLRTFVKVSVSRDRYDLRGNAVNPALDYQWQMRSRAVQRNVPQMTSQNSI